MSEHVAHAVPAQGCKSAFAQKIHALLMVDIISDISGCLLSSLVAGFIMAAGNVIYGNMSLTLNVFIISD